MEKEDFKNLFKSFSRGKAGKKYSTEGIGVGLYLAKILTEMHKGKIWAESQGKGKGSQFYIWLPQ